MTTMTHTYSLPHSQLNYHYNKYALTSVAFVSLFVVYFLIPHEGVLTLLSKLNVVFIVFVPALTLALSIISLKQITRSHEKGSAITYVALGITLLYFIVALAIPLVLIGLYLLYSYVL